jgi:EAL domain-containing protein (putative c-di-GMP-specific phosphodiesterase class I)
MARHAGGPDELIRDLEGAIERREFRLEYQPVVRLGGAVVAGAEALLRWRHPRRGAIAPNDFLPLAESAGLIDPIGRFVLDEAARTAAGWPRTAERPGFVSVNFVPAQLRQPAAAAEILAALARAGLEPTLLTVELTSGLGRGANEIDAAVAGVRVALDDFGTATTLSDLKRIPVDQVKLAREFVVDVIGPPDTAAFALSLISIADVRDVEVVAKGVESREQAWRLAELGCRYGQGFFFSKPLGASGVLAVLRQGTLRG